MESIGFKRAVVCFGMVFALWANADEGARSYDCNPHPSENYSQALRENGTNWEIPVATGFLYGSPEYSEFCNVLRNYKAMGQKLMPWQEAFLHAGEFPNVDQNSWLIIENNSRTSVGLSLANDKTHDDPNFGVKLYLQTQGQRFVEIGTDLGIYGVMVPVMMVSKKPIEELYFAIKSRSLGDSMKGNALAVFDTAKGPVLATMRIGSNIAQGDVTGTLKAVIQVPYAVFEFAGVTVLKTIRTPVDLIVAGVKGIMDLFSSKSQEEEEEEALAEAAEIHERAVRKKFNICVK